MVFQVFGEYRFGDLLGQPQVEAVPTARQTEVELTERAPIRSKACPTDLHPLTQNPVSQSQRFENLDRPRMHDCGAVPVQWCIVRVDQKAIDIAPNQFRRQEQPGRSGSDDNDGRPSA